MIVHLFFQLIMLCKFVITVDNFLSALYFVCHILHLSLFAAGSSSAYDIFFK